MKTTDLKAGTFVFLEDGSTVFLDDNLTGFVRTVAWESGEDENGGEVYSRELILTKTIVAACPMGKIGEKLKWVTIRHTPEELLQLF